MIVHRSPFPDVEIPERSITEVVLSGLAGREDEPVLVDGPTGRTLTGGTLVDLVHRFAGGLTARGFGAGHTIAVMAPNIPEYAVVFHGAAWAGGTVTTVNPTYTAEELRFQLLDAGAELLVTIPLFLETAREAVEGTAVAEIVVIGEAEGATPVTALLGDPITEQVPVDLADHVVVLPYSSGTTGLPKGVMLTHRNLVANIAQVEALFDRQAGEATLAVLPFFHIYGMQVLMNYYLSVGGVVVTLPRFDLEAALSLAQEHRMRRLFVVPPIVLALAKHPLVDQYDLSSVQSVLSGAAPLGADLAQECAARLGCEVIQGYGMTELSPVTHTVPDGRGRPGAAGLTVPNTSCRVVDPATGEDLDVGGEGELWITGPQVMKGYLNNPQATAETIDDEGWLHTGDVARFDADGYLWIVDRVKELIKYKGFQVPPAELEALLVTHPGVADVAVVGIPDVEAGELPMAYVVRAPGSEVTTDELQEFVADHVATYKRIRRVEFIDEIPKSASGKILRRVLRSTSTESSPA